MIFLENAGSPYVKGMVHQQMGQYRKALVNYEQADSLRAKRVHKMRAIMHWHRCFKAVKRKKSLETVKKDR